jgi:microcystin degradation protein MlrC
VVVATLSSTPARILVGAFALEANSFAPGSTTIADFVEQVWAVGDDVTPDALGPHSELHAAWDVLSAHEIDVVPSIVAWSAPRQPLDPEVLDAIVGHVLARCDEQLAGAYLMLHGAAIAHGEDDPEGLLLAALRGRLGPDRPIAISLDCHANLTPRMTAAVDIVTSYRTCPHIDTRRTGEQAARLLVAALNGDVQPVVSFAAQPMITPPQLHDNELEPFRTLMRRCTDLEQRPGILAVGLLPVQPWIDVPGLSWKAVVTSDNDPELGQQIAEELIAEAWVVRERFLDGAAPGIDEALEIALSGEAPYVVADAGDSTNGGAIGDSTELLRAALRRNGGARVLLSIADPVAAATAFAAGAGAKIKLSLGHGGAGEYNERAAVDAEVVATFDGSFAYTHPVNAGYRASTGPAALVRCGSIDVVAHTRSVGVIDPAIYEALGADPRDYHVIQAKSHVSYRTGFDPVTSRSVVASTGGPTTADLTRLDFRKRPHPLFPFER